MLKLDVRRKMLTTDGEKILTINTEIPNGKLVCFFGKSGAGKTTMMRMISGLLEPMEGSISFNDIVWFDSKKKLFTKPQQRNIGYMFQDYALFPNMTVEGNIRYGQTIRNEDEVEYLLQLFDLTKLRKQKPTRLSGGQKQRCALARALARKPKLLLLDEPLSSLDYEMRISLQEEILKAHQLMGVTTLMVSHDKEEIRKMADLVITIQKGVCNTIGINDFQ